MALGLEVAVVLRARGGVNFLMHTNGIGYKDANSATKQAIDILTAFAESGGKADLDKSGDRPPGFTSGQVLVSRGRLVNAIWVLTVTPAAANVLLCTQIISAVVQLLVAASKGVDVTPDRVARRYPEVYLASGQLLAPGGLSTPPARLLANAEAEVATISPETGAKAKGPTASIKSRLGVGGSRKVIPSSASGSSLYNPDTSGSTKRLSPRESEFSAGGTFVLPPETLNLQEASETPSLARREEAAAPPGILDDLLAPPLPVAGSEFLAGTGLETLEAPPIDYDRRFSNLRPPPPPPVSDNPWADFDLGTAPQGASRGLGGALAQPPPPLQKPVLPPPTSKQQRSIANGNALQLVEVWKAVFQGGWLQMAGTFGEVLSTGSVPKCKAEAVLALSVDNARAPKSSAALVQAIQGERGVTRFSEQGEILADFGEAPKMEAPFIRFNLPPNAVEPPIIMAVSMLRKPCRAPKAARKLSSAVRHFEEPMGAASAELNHAHDESVLDPAQGIAESLSEPRQRGTEQRSASEENQAAFSGAESTVEAEIDAEIEAAVEAELEAEVQADIAAGLGADEVDKPSHDDTAAEQTDAGFEAEDRRQVQEDSLEGELREASPESRAKAETEADSAADSAVLARPRPSEDSSAKEQACGLSQPETNQQSRELATETRQNGSHVLQEPTPAEEDRECMLSISIAVNPGLAGPLRGVCVDLDVHPLFGQLLKASGTPQWSPNQRRLRWTLYTLEPGSNLRLRATFSPPQGRELTAACSKTMASLHAFGPAGHGLSGILLQSGSLGGKLKDSRRAFHCEVHAKPLAPEVLKERSKAGMLQSAALILEKQMQHAPQGALEDVEESGED